MTVLLGLRTLSVAGVAVLGRARPVRCRLPPRVAGPGERVAVGLEVGLDEFRCPVPAVGDMVASVRRTVPHHGRVVALVAVPVPLLRRGVAPVSPQVASSRLSVPVVAGLVPGQSSPIALIARVVSAVTRPVPERRGVVTRRPGFVTTTAGLVSHPCHHVPRLSVAVALIADHVPPVAAKGHLIRGTGAGRALNPHTTS